MPCGSSSMGYGRPNRSAQPPCDDNAFDLGARNPHQNDGGGAGACLENSMADAPVAGPCTGELQGISGDWVTATLGPMLPCRKAPPSL